MPLTLPELLARFRPVGAPGRAASGGGVPGDRYDALVAELAPVLALLDETQHRCEATVESATRECRQLRQRAQREVRDIDASAAGEARRAEEAAYRAVLDVAAAEAARVSAAGCARADAVRARGAVLLPGLVDEAVRLVAALVASREGAP